MLACQYCDTVWANQFAHGIQVEQRVIARGGRETRAGWLPMAPD